MKPALLIECHRERMPEFLGKWPEIAPMALWECAPWFEYRNDVSILKEIAPRLRGLRFDWFAAVKPEDGTPIPDMKSGIQSARDARAAMNAIGIRKRIRAAFIDVEYPRHILSLAALREQAQELQIIAPLYCNFNNSATGQALWGNYDGAVGTSNLQAYEVTSNSDFRRFISNIVSNQTWGSVVHLPPVWVEGGAKEFGTAQILAWLSQIVLGAIKEGVRTFMFADYMVENQARVPLYMDHISDLMKWGGAKYGN